MRTRILAAVYLLVVFAGVACYFAPADLGRFWSRPAQPIIDAAPTTPPLTGKQREDDIRKKLAFVSLRAQLPKGTGITPSQPLAAEVKTLWEEIETNLAFSDRAEMLKALHEKTRDVFVDRPGAGMGRMVVRPEDILMDREYWNDQHRRQPGEPAAFPQSASEPVTRVRPDGEFRDLHSRGVLSFLPSRSLGYVKDRDHVSGFKPHGFRYAPVSQASRALRIDHIHLVGILTHEQPMVYLTDKLPSMEQIRQDKVRPLDFFEEAGLPSLYHGEDLYIVSKDDTLRMLGALRATKTCQKCHDAQIGDLLGAFSYTLRPAAKAKDGGPP